MAGDRARVSFDPSRKWRGLIAQQGRVTVEADWNEAATIDLERDRLQALDVVGPVGTPDHGYSVTAFPAGATAPATPGDLTIGPGTLYLGGERLDLDAAVTYSTQPDWLDHSTDPLWVQPAANGNELVYLLASEQEVSAVEDPALADVALGGPDTMQRQRILQHVVRQPSQAGTLRRRVERIREFAGRRRAAVRRGIDADRVGHDAAGVVHRHTRRARPVPARRNRRLPGRREPDDPGDGHQRRRADDRLGIRRCLLPVPGCSRQQPTRTHRTRRSPSPARRWTAIITPPAGRSSSCSGTRFSSPTTTTSPRRQVSSRSSPLTTTRPRCSW